MKMEEDDAFWNWFAGFWEGEGSLSFYIGFRGKKQAKMVVAQRYNPSPLYYIKEHLGGCVWKYQKTGDYFWGVHKPREILQICRKLLNYLRFKHDLVKRGIEELQKIDASERNKAWTKEEIEFLKNHPEMTAREIALKLNRNVISIRSMRQRLRLFSRKIYGAHNVG